MAQFQSTPPRGGDLPFAVLLPSFVRISIHAPSRGRPLPKWIQMMTYDFNPRPLAGATRESHKAGKGGRFQSTPPRGGDIEITAGDDSITISIHAPSRGRRVGDCLHHHFTFISIHAPSRGRQLTSDFWPVRSLFQSTPPRGGDASTRWTPSSMPDFNPRPLAGATTSITAC